MRKYGILLIICIFQILLSCTKVPVGPSLKDILSANSKLQVVLDKYKDDSLNINLPSFSLKICLFTIAMKVNLWMTT